ncbi:hypothetical protein [Miltoncostaea oceani]|uniref:hypothetical protein n=1 Tax=Miltoncostaea oceani TaxID=2843216 RepID=UPI001C3D74E7|nr:hypothetical protein [Miltoncostaea oceani]
MRRLTSLTSRSADVAARERLILWHSQRLFAASSGACAIGFAWLVHSLGYGPGPIAVALICQLAPTIVSGRLAGSLRVLRHGRQRILAVSQVLAAFACLAAMTSGTPAALIVIFLAAVVFGVARAVFDATSLDVIHHLVNDQRKVESIRSLTARHGEGQIAGAVIALSAGALAGPSAALACAAVVAAAGGLCSLRHSDLIDLVIGEKGPVAHEVRASLRVMARERRTRTSQVAGAIGAGLAGAQAALLIPWLVGGGAHLGRWVAPTLLSAVVGFWILRAPLARLVRILSDRLAAALAFGGLSAGYLSIARVEDPRVLAMGYCLILLAFGILAGLANNVRLQALSPDTGPATGLAGAALWAASGSLGAAGSALLSGALAPGSVLIVMAALAALAALAFYLWITRPVPRRLLPLALRR